MLVSECLILCSPLYPVYVFVPYLRLCTIAYVPTYGDLFEKNSFANKKYSYREIDTVTVGIIPLQPPIFLGQKHMSIKVTLSNF